MSVVGSSSTVQPLRVLRPLASRALRRAVVGDGGGHDDDVGAAPRVERLALEVRGGRRLDDLDAGRRPGRRGSRASSVTSAPRRARLRGERDAHAARRAVADEAHGVERLARAAGGDEDALARQRARGRREQLLARGEDLLRLGHPAHAELALGSLALVGADSSTPRARSSSAFACVGRVRPHARVHRRRDERAGPRCASAASVRTLSARPCASFASVFAVQRRDDQQVGALEVRVRILAGGLPRERREGLARVTNRSAPRRDERDDVVARLDEQPQSSQAL